MGRPRQVLRARLVRFAAMAQDFRGARKGAPAGQRLARISLLTAAHRARPTMRPVPTKRPTRRREEGLLLQAPAFGPSCPAAPRPPHRFPVGPHPIDALMHARPLPLATFALAALLPLPLLGLGAVQGGGWLWAAFLYMGVLTILLDQLIPLVPGDAQAEEFPAADGLLVVLGVSALCLLPLATWAIAGPSPLSASERIVTFLAAGFWLGQVAHPAAHELIHRPKRPLFRLGSFHCITLLPLPPPGNPPMGACNAAPAPGDGA